VSAGTDDPPVLLLSIPSQVCKFYSVPAIVSSQRSPVLHPQTTAECLPTVDLAAPLEECFSDLVNVTAGRRRREGQLVSAGSPLPCPPQLAGVDDIETHGRDVVRPPVAVVPGTSTGPPLGRPPTRRSSSGILRLGCSFNSVAVAEKQSEQPHLSGPVGGDCKALPSIPEAAVWTEDVVLSSATDQTRQC